MRWKLRDGVPPAGEEVVEEEEVCELLVVLGRWSCGRGGVKWEGEAERVVQDGSEDVNDGPLSRAEASARDWERRRSWAERNCGGGSDGGREAAVAGDAVAVGYE